MQLTITARIQARWGHRVDGLIHTHAWTVEATVEGPADAEIVMPADDLEDLLHREVAPWAGHYLTVLDVGAWKSFTPLVWDREPTVEETVRRLWASLEPEVPALVRTEPHRVRGVRPRPHGSPAPRAGAIAVLVIVPVVDIAPLRRTAVAGATAVIARSTPRAARPGSSSSSATASTSRWTTCSTPPAPSSPRRVGPRRRGDAATLVGYKADGVKEMFDVGLTDAGDQWPDLAGFRERVERYQSGALAWPTICSPVARRALGISERSSPSA